MAKWFESGRLGGVEPRSVLTFSRATILRMGEEGKQWETDMKSRRDKL